MQGSDLKTFVGAQDYETSKDFYTAMGFALNWDQGNLAELQLGACKFLLQRYYQEDWCNNLMLHMTVDDAWARYKHAQQALSLRPFGAARVTEPELQSYGSLVTYLWDPSGVLWHLAQPRDEYSA